MYTIQFKDDRQIRKMIKRYFGTMTYFAGRVGLSRNFIILTLKKRKNLSLDSANWILDAFNQESDKQFEFEDLFVIKEK